MDRTIATGDDCLRVSVLSTKSGYPTEARKYRTFELDGRTRVGVVATTRDLGWGRAGRWLGDWGENAGFRQVERNV